MSETFTEDIRENLNALESAVKDKGSLQERKANMNIEDKLPRDTENKKKMISKHIQVEFEGTLPSGGLIFDLKAEMYWQDLAETKRIELEDALEENERLCKLKEMLTKENVHYKQLLEEANSFVDVFKDLIQESSDDTGIDVRDINNSNNEEQLQE